ncbi:MAG TPA: GNAT family N-acetyltransferase [Kiloniellales bacterium]|nr:GNAT family N-acetyltransferase [Kiloniellales bacterium]
MSLDNGFYDIPRGKIAAVVTYLEMHEKPPLRPARAAPDWELRPVERPAVEWYRSLYRRVGEDWLWFSRLLLSDEELGAILQDPDIDFHVFRAGGRDEGIIELDFRKGTDCELAFFGISPALLGRGAGRWLMNQALELAWSRPIGRLWLHTCTLDHPQAVSFYCRSGFHPYRREVEVADDPRLVGKARKEAAPHVPIL